MTQQIFEKFKLGLKNLDPVYFCESNLILDGKPFRINGNGYKPYADIYRYIGIKALEEDSKPVVLVKGRQVGATTMAANLEMYFMTSGLFGNNGRPPIRVLHCFPTLVHVYEYAKTKLRATISQSKLIDDPKKPNKKIPFVESCIDKSSDASNSLQFKQFIDGNFLRVESTGLDADRLRGGTADVILYDEVQDIFKEAISNANKLLSQAKYGNGGVKVYFGTPKQRGGHYWDMWQMSNQQYYHLGCEECKKLFPLYTPGSDEWKKIWLYGFTVKCPHCGCEQDKRDAAERGMWVPMRPENDKYVGYHINQMYMPNYTKEKILDERPEVNPSMTERGYQNEVLGEFFRGEASPITPEEIKEKCADPDRGMSEGISINENKKVYVGFDWGGKDFVDGERKTQGQSYSSAVVLTEEGPNRLSIKFANLLKRNDIETKKDIVNEIYRRYSVTLGIGDIGFANDLSEILYREHGHRFLASRSSPNVSGRIKFDESYMPPTIVFEKDYYIGELFNMMKRGMIRFPFKSYEKIIWLVNHCSSMEIKTTSNVYGEAIYRFVKGTTPNDGLMALLNAYLAYKFDVSGGFSNKMAGLMDKPGPKKISAVLGYIPRM